jgi:hypothetical protein
MPHITGKKHKTTKTTKTIALFSPVTDKTFETHFRVEISVIQIRNVLKIWK